MRVVLDTNVFVSGLLWGGSANRLLKWTRDGTLTAVSCDEAMVEMKRVFEYPKFSRRISALDSSAPQIIAYAMNLVTHVPSPEFIPAVVAEDPTDDLFLVLAVENQARLIVSGDQHLLALKEHQRIPIVTPGEAVDVVAQLLAK
jgi:putative PIN family toxin of toxin-antitoxin system